MAEVELDHLTKRYGERIVAVHDLSLRVPDGELLVLVGPSGCGKTTTLRLLAGLEKLSSGTIRLAGRIANDLPPRVRNLAMVFQRPALYPHLNVRDNLGFSLRMQRCRDWAGRVAEVARILKLEDVLDRRPSQLSGGQQQRVALGRALARKPGVYLLDEPLASLDVGLRTEMRRELHLLHRRLGVTMMYVTHDQVEATTLGDRVVVMKSGSIQQVGPPNELYERPANRFVAGFIGWPAMNLLDGELVRCDGKLALTSEENVLALARADYSGWERFLQRRVTVGIRPEDVRLGSVGNSSEIDNTNIMKVVLVESLGNASLVTVQQGDWLVTAKVANTDKPGDGQMVGVTWNMAKMHLFDGVTGVALAGRPDG